LPDHAAALGCTILWMEILGRFNVGWIAVMQSFYRLAGQECISPWSEPVDHPGNRGNPEIYRAKRRKISFSIDGTCCPASSAPPKWATFGSLPHAFPRAWFNLL